MSDPQNIPWRRIAVEATAIVGSILLAFGVQAWWDERLERIDEAEQLARLHTEFTENIERISVRAEPYVANLDSTRAAFELIEAAQNQGDDDIKIPARTLRRMLYVPTFEADTPIMDGLIRSGRLEIIEDQSLLRPIAQWERQLRNYTAFSVRARRTLDTHLVPALAMRGDVGWVMMVERFSSSPRSNETVTIRIDNEFKTLVAERFRNGSSAYTTFGSLKEAAEEVLAAIEASQSN
jgi:hypothetical protein